MLTGAARKKFLELANKCASRDQMERIRGRLAMNKLALEHSDDVLQATFDDIMKRAKKK